MLQHISSFLLIHSHLQLFLCLYLLAGKQIRLPPYHAQSCKSSFLWLWFRALPGGSTNLWTWHIHKCHLPNLFIYPELWMQLLLYYLIVLLSPFSALTFEYYCLLIVCLRLLHQFIHKACVTLVLQFNLFLYTWTLTTSFPIVWHNWVWELGTRGYTPFLGWRSEQWCGVDGTIMKSGGALAWPFSFLFFSHLIRKYLGGLFFVFNSLTLLHLTTVENWCNCITELGSTFGGDWRPKKAGK